MKDGHVATAMCAYNKVNGVYACQNSFLMQDVFKNEYQFGGFIRSDFGAVHDVAASYNAGMDQAKPQVNDQLKAAVQAGEVPTSRIDDAVSRVLREMFRFHLFDHPPTGTPDTIVTSPQHAATARSIAEQGTVLLKNARGTLPLSSAMNVTYTQGIAPNGALPPVPSSALTPPSGSGHGVLGQYYNNETRSGTPVLTRTGPNIDFTWGVGQDAESPGPGVNATNWSAKWTGTLTAPATGTYTFSLTSDDGSEFSINGQQVVDDGGNHAVQTRQGTIALVAGQSYQLEVDYFNNVAGDQVHLGWAVPGSDQYGGAVQAAKNADVAIVFANDVESEGTDRPNLSLPFNQDGLISAVSAANPNTIVVLNTGSAVTMPWLDSVKGVVEGWYAGQEDGNAIAAVLFGDVNPSGKLPLTFPKSEADTPAHTPAQWPGVAGNSSYSEGLQVGYRWYDAQGIQPLFPFGYGLSYTSFRVSRLSVGPRQLRPNGHETVTAYVTNTGSRAGAEVVQLYVAAPASTNEPPKQLKGFQKVSLKPGETRRVTFRLTPRDLAYWDSRAHGWVTGGGTYRVLVGTSSRDVPLSGSFAVTRTTGPRYVSVTAPSIIDPGATATVTTSFTNDSSTAVHQAKLSLTAPTGWGDRSISPSSFTTVRAGQTVVTRSLLTVPATARPGDYQLTATARYQAAGRRQSSSDTVTVSVAYPSMAAAYDNVGITDDSDHAPGNFDGAGNSYSAQALADAGITPGSNVTERGITFTWPDVPSGTADNVAMQGQLISLSGSGGTLGVLGAATSATQRGTGTVFYTDGSTQDFTLTFPDWFSNTPPAGDDLVVTTSHLNRTNGKPPHTVSLFAAYVALAAGKTVQAVRLPNAGSYGMHAFAVATGASSTSG